MSPADGDENGSAPAKSGKEICADPHELFSGCELNPIEMVCHQIIHKSVRV
jgi:hypothetical protein